MQIQVANIVNATEAEGPGRRFAIWLQGCPLRCPSCCNPEMLPFGGGTAMQVDQILRAIKASQSDHEIEGITLLGGEPFAQAEPAAELSEQVRSRGLTVMVFSGFTLEGLADQADPHVDRLLACTDILVDGPYQKDQPEESRRWIGSANQQVHFLSDRYRPGDECWRQRDTLEIRLRSGELSVNGFPAVGAVGVWKRPRPKPIGDK
jgi:anaerobic ribonucleoside-triphosphate reductase activating protein